MLITGMKQKVFFGENAVCGAVLGSLYCALGHPACWKVASAVWCNAVWCNAVLAWHAVFCLGKEALC